MKFYSCPVLIAFNVKGLIVPIYCGMWKCDRCRRQLAKMWAARALLGIKTLEGKAKFWTLTMLPRYKLPQQAYKVLPRLWDGIRKEMQRKYKRWDYIAFVEGQPERSDMPHFHIISMCEIPDSYPRIKEFALHHGFGYEAYDVPVTPRQGAAYVAKYVSKSTPGITRGFHRARASTKWPKLPDKGEYDAYIVQRKDELYMDYILRVSDETGIEPDDLNESYNKGLTLYMIRSTNLETLDKD